jgi:hypothetical protein
MKFEYKTFVADAPEASEKQLNEFGADAWELVTIVPWKGRWYYYFKRAKPAS